MSSEDPLEGMGLVIDPELKKEALKEMEEWGTELEEGATLQKLLTRNIQAAGNVLRSPASSEKMKEEKRQIVQAAFGQIGIGEATSKRIIADIEKRLRH